MCIVILFDLFTMMSFTSKVQCYKFLVARAVLSKEHKIKESIMKVEIYQPGPEREIEVSIKIQVSRSFSVIYLYMLKTFYQSL